MVESAELSGDGMTLLTKKKRKRMRSSKKTISRRKLVLELDKLTRETVLERDCNSCVRCGNTEYLTVSHVYPKGTFGNLRWELDNLKILCLSCHRVWHMNPVEMADWWRKKYPERYERLSLARHTAPKVDMQALLAELRDATLPPHTEVKYMNPIPASGLPF